MPNFKSLHAASVQQAAAAGAAAGQATGCGSAAAEGRADARLRGKTPLFLT